MVFALLVFDICPKAQPTISEGGHSFYSFIYLIHIMSVYLWYNSLSSTGAMHDPQQWWSVGLPFYFPFPIVSKQGIIVKKAFIKAAQRTFFKLPVAFSHTLVCYLKARLPWTDLHAWKNTWGTALALMWLQMHHINLWFWEYVENCIFQTLR